MRFESLGWSPQSRVKPHSKTALHFSTYKCPACFKNTMIYTTKKKNNGFRMTTLLLLPCLILVVKGHTVNNPCKHPTRYFPFSNPNREKSTCGHRHLGFVKRYASEFQQNDNRKSKNPTQKNIPLSLCRTDLPISTISTIKCSIVVLRLIIP